MNVLGVGLDLVEVPSFARQLETPGTSFATSTFTRRELAAAGSVADTDAPAYARHLAARFAGKEAFVKAWSIARSGAPPAMDEVLWQDLEVLCDDWGRPRLFMAGHTADRVEDTLGPVSVSVSLTHEQELAGAVVVLSAAGFAPGDPGGTGLGQQAVGTR